MNDDTKKTADAANAMEHAQREKWAKDDLRRQWQRIFHDDAPMLAIARCVAVLASRGVMLEADRE